MIKRIHWMFGLAVLSCIVSTSVSCSDNNAYKIEDAPVSCRLNKPVDIFLSDAYFLLRQGDDHQCSPTLYEKLKYYEKALNSARQEKHITQKNKDDYYEFIYIILERLIQNYINIGNYHRALSLCENYYYLIENKYWDYNVQLDDWTVECLAKLGRKKEAYAILKNKEKGNKLTSSLCGIADWYQKMGLAIDLERISRKIIALEFSDNKEKDVNTINTARTFLFYALLMQGKQNEAQAIKLKILSDFYKAAKTDFKGLDVDFVHNRVGIVVLLEKLYAYDDVIKVYKRLSEVNPKLYMEKYLIYYYKLRQYDKYLLEDTRLRKLNPSIKKSAYNKVDLECFYELGEMRKLNHLLYKNIYKRKKINPDISLDEFYQSYFCKSIELNEYSIYLFAESSYHDGILESGKKRTACEYANYCIIKSFYEYYLYWLNKPDVVKENIEKVRNAYAIEFEKDRWDYKYHLHIGDLNKTYQILWETVLKPDPTARNFALVGDLCLYYKKCKLDDTKHINSLLAISDCLIDEQIFMARLAMLAPTRLEEAKKFFKKYKARVAQMPLGNVAIAIGKYLIGEGSEKEVFAIQGKTKSQKNRNAVYANFYIGQKYFQDGNVKTAKTYFKKIFEQKYLGFNVVGIATYLLK